MDEEYNIQSNSQLKSANEDHNNKLVNTTDELKIAGPKTTWQNKNQS